MNLLNKATVLNLPNGPVDRELAHFVDAYAKDFQPNCRVAVAYSGGADSTALLLAAARRWPGQVIALHVHHGLQDAAEDFVQHTQQRCAALEIPYYLTYTDAKPAKGESPEDAARKHRYSALSSMAKEQGADLILVGQHLDDQIETFLLALSRGAGLPGLSGMSDWFSRGGARYARPLLGLGVDSLKVWLRDSDVHWVEDPTNQERIYTRNRIRLDIAPVLESIFPSYRTTFVRSMEHINQAQQLLEELAAEDLLLVGAPPNIKRVQQLSAARQGNVIRHWLKQAYVTAPSKTQLNELLKQLHACTTRGHQINVKVGHGRVSRKGENLSYQDNFTI